MTWHLLWTDIFVFLLVGMVILFLYSVSKQPYLKVAFQQVMIKPIPVSSGIILLAFVLIGLLDSIHFKLQEPTKTFSQKGEIVSILDSLLTPMRMSEETTFSAPFALRAFNKTTKLVESTQEGKDDSVSQENAGKSQSQESMADKTKTAELDYPRLNLNKNIQEDKHLESILILLLKGFGLGVFFNMAISLAVSTLGRHYYPILNKMPRKTSVFTLLLLMVGLGVVVACMPYYHILGTSKVGSDVLYQCLKSIRTALVIGCLTTLIMLPFAVILGIMAGYFKGFWDDVISYLYTTLSAVPGVLLIAAAVMSLQVSIDNHPQWFPTMLERADVRLLCLCVILGITSWTGLCRILRGEALKLREIDYVQAAKALGVGPFGIIFKHLLPNMMHIILISIALDFSGLVLAEAVLSYVGVGVDPASFSFGTLINSARLEMARAPVVWWSLFGAFFFMFTLVLSANLFADALRDAFDPRSQKDAV